jgi:hypothetical protein
MNLRSPMKHASLQHLSKRDRWLRLQRFNGTWIGNTGLLVFLVTGFGSFVLIAMLFIRLDLHQWFRGKGDGSAVAAIAWIPAIAVGALAWEAFRRVMINRVLDRSSICGCGYDLAGLARSAKCPECGRSERA